MSLVAEVRAVLEAAGADLDGSAADRAAAALARLDEPLRVAIAGKVKAGKSTLLNALVGEELAPTDAGECTRIVTWYRDGHTYAVHLHPREGEARQVRFVREAGAVEVDLDGTDPAEVERLVVTWPSSRLRDLTLIDTPGIESASVEVSQRTIDLLVADDDRPREADAVLYLLRHLHATDVRFLEAFHDDAIAHASPVHALGVLSRADEVGACRLDAMDAARRIAGRYRADPKVRRLVQTVVPVAGLVAQVGVTLTEDEHRRIVRLAALPPAQREGLLLSADRFTADDPALPVTAVEREDLLARLGVFGVRHALAEVAEARVGTSGELAASLRAASGIDDLRRLLDQRFASRSTLLKARSALDVLDDLADEVGGSAGAELGDAVARVRAGAHELVEVRLLDELRTGDLRLRDAERDDLERLVGGGAPEERLGLAEGAAAVEVRAAAGEALARWQARAESAMSSQPVRDAARVAVRTCEGLLAAPADG